MSAEELRKVLLTVALDEGFSNRLRANPEEALKGYILTNQEKARLTNPTIDLLDRVRTASNELPPWVIWLFPSLAHPDVIAPLAEADKEKFIQLVRDIRNSVSHERFDMIMDLIRQVQARDQASE